MQPKSIKMFQVFAWISLGLSTLVVLLLLVAGGILVSAVGGGALYAVFMLIAVASLVGMAFLIHLAANKRSNVARWIYVVLGGLGVLFGLLSLIGGNSNVGGVLMMLVLSGVQAAAIVFLLMPDANAWFAGHAYNPGYGGGYPPQHGGGYPPQVGGGYPPQVGGGYPPQQGGGYPPQQGGGYPPQQGGGYPPQQGGGYPPQQSGGYPPQQGGGYPPQHGGGGYPPQGGGGHS